MAGYYIDLKIKINSHAPKIWRTLIEPEYNVRWASVFKRRSKIECDWEMGSELVWKDKLGKILSEGRVIERDAWRVIAVAYLGDENMGFDTNRYEEVYTILDEGDHCILNISAGDYGNRSKEEEDKIRSIWQKVLEKIKKIAEK